MGYSNQFPRKQDIEQKTITERANFIFENFEERMHDLFIFITDPSQRDRLNKEKYNDLEQH